MYLEIVCRDFLKDNNHSYARDAADRRITLVEVRATNQCPFEMRLMLGSSRLTSIEDDRQVVTSALGSSVLLQELLSGWGWPRRRVASEAMWGVLVAANAIIFWAAHGVEPDRWVALWPFLLFVPLLFSLGPLYNYRLRRQLASLSNGDLLLMPGESKTALIAFRDAATLFDHLLIPLRRGDAEPESIEYRFYNRPVRADVADHSSKKRQWSTAPVD